MCVSQWWGDGERRVEKTLLPILYSLLPGAKRPSVEVD